MIKRLPFLILIITTLSTCPAFGFKQSDLDKLLKTKECTGCDLQDADLKEASLKDAILQMPIFKMRT